MNYWAYKNLGKTEKITSIGEMPAGVTGFVYEVTFDDGTRYIGKKNLYGTRTMKPLKNGKERENSTRIVKNTKKGYRQAWDIVRKESDWLKYQGSHKACQEKIVKGKLILEYAFSPRHLTYLEAKYLFTYQVLEHPKYLNDNILGSFFRGNLV